MLTAEFRERFGLADGFGQVAVRSGGLLGRLLRRTCRLPRSGTSTARLTIRSGVDGGERWTRHYGHRTMTSTMHSSDRGLVDSRLVEKLGVLALEFDIFDDGTAASLRLFRFGLGPIRLAAGRFLSITATSRRHGDELTTDVNIKLLGGWLGWVSYSVTLKDCSANPCPPSSRIEVTE